MTRRLLLTTVAICAAAFFSMGATCGGSEDDGGGGGGGGGGSSVFTGYKCDGSAKSGTCDNAMCQIRKAYEVLTANCARVNLPICDKAKKCVSDFGTCFRPKCPSGGTASADATKCSAAYSQCVTAALRP